MKFDRLFKILFPENYTCVICGDDVFNKYSICKHCIKALPYLTGKICLHCSDPLVSLGDYCKRCKGRTFFYDRAIAPFVYEGEIQKLVHSFKFSNKRYLCKSFAIFMADKFKAEKLYADIVVPVPLCDKRLKQRGYNQSKLLAIEFSKLTNVPLSPDVLKRIKETPNQTSLNFLERQTNLIGAFKVKNKKQVAGKSIVLIDDVFTTGATVTECAKMLKSAGASSVYVVTLAHTNKTNE